MSLKSVIKKMIPRQLLRAYRWLRLRNKPKGYLFQGKSSIEVFNSIYQSNHWKNVESVSGPGSSVENTKHLRQKITDVIREYHIRTILDIPCGDFNWMRHVELSGVQYLGADIVEGLVRNNQSRFGCPTLKFTSLNLLTDALPSSDLVICRDCLVHFSNEDIHRAIDNIKRSESKLLLTTTFTDCMENEDIITGGWRPINLQKGPFNFGSTEMIFNEETPESKRFRDKSMLLIKIRNL